MFCQKCGNQLAEDAAFCPKCGVKIETINHTCPVSENSVQAHNDLIKNKDQSDSVQNDAVLKELIGKSADYYLKEFSKIERGEKSFNWCALLFGPILALYRKQFSYFAKVYLPVFALSFLVHIVNFCLYEFARPVENFGYISLINILTITYGIAAAIFSGMYFNKLYMKSLHKVISSNCLLDLKALTSNLVIKKTKPSVGIPVVVYAIYAVLILVLQATAPSIVQLRQAPYIIMDDGTVVFQEEYLTGKPLPDSEREKRIAKIDPDLLQPSKAALAETKTNYEEEYIAISIVAYKKEFEENSIAADEKYRNKLLEVTGKVTSINQMNDVVYVGLEEELDEKWGWLICSFNLNRMDEIKKIKTGDVVTIKGRSRGNLNAVMGDDMGGCHIVNDTSANTSGENSMNNATANDVLYKDISVISLFDASMDGVTALFGEPTYDGEHYGGGYARIYNDEIMFVLFADTHETIAIETMKPEVFKVGDVSLDKDREFLIKAFGTPTDEYVDEMSGEYTISYNFNRYSLRFILPDSSSMISKISIWVAN